MLDNRLSTNVVSLKFLSSYERFYSPPNIIQNKIPLLAKIYSVNKYWQNILENLYAMK